MSASKEHSRPWQRIHIGKDVPDIRSNNSVHCLRGLDFLSSVFQIMGHPLIIKIFFFLKSNGIKHIRSSPYQPATNGLAERFVHTFKRALFTREDSGRTVHHHLTSFLLCYCNTPHATTNRSPAELFLKRALHTKLNLLKPDGSSRVAERQAMQKKHHDSRAAQREWCYQAGDAVMARNFHHGLKWLPGTVAEVNLSYIIQLKSGLIWRRHINQMRDGIRKQSPMAVSVSAPTHPDGTAHTKLDDTAYTPSDIGTHIVRVF